MISQVLRNSAKRFSEASGMVCLEYSYAIAADGICSPIDRTMFKILVMARMSANVEVIPPVRSAA
ncbi:MAG: hypothetical protein ACKPCM_15975 [Pseudanabaena sp.]